MEEILIDTDAVIDFLRGYDLRVKSFFSEIQNRQIKGYISLISNIELYAGIEEENSRQEINLNKLLSILEVLPVDFKLVKPAGFFGRKYHLSITDSIIAATSSYHKIRLFTFNIKHFANLPGVKLYSQ